MKRSARIAAWIGIGLLAGIALALVAVMVLTRTEFGMERARRFALGWLDERIEGELTIGRIGGSGLLGGVTLYDVAIDDPKGRPFLRVDSARVAYNWRTLLGGDIALERVWLFDPEVYLEQLPGDSIWNFEYVFPDTTPGSSESGRSLVMFEDARIVNGIAVLRQPIDAPIEADDTARTMYEEMPGGLLRTMRLEIANARLDRVIWETPFEPGKLFDIRELSGRAFIWRDPLVVNALRGRLTLRDSITAFDVPQLELPDSRASLIGRIVSSEGKNRLDIQVNGEQLRFSDLQWLYPKLPAEGGGNATLRIQTLPDGTLFLAQNATLFAPGTRVAGTFGIVMGENPYFTQVDLRASPLDVELIEQMLPGVLPVEGLLVGTIEVSGPISALETSGDMRLSSGPSSGSGVRWSGTVDARDGLRPRELRADLTTVDAGLLARLAPRLDLPGRVSGRIETRSTSTGIGFTADLEHRLPAQMPTRIEGAGSLAGDGAFDVQVNAFSTTLEQLAAHYPALDDLRGEVSGPVRVRGTLQDLTVEARLATAGGPLDVDARLQRDSIAHYTGTATAPAFELGQIVAGAPDARISGTLGFDISGGTARALRGTLRADIDSAALVGVALVGTRGAPLASIAGNLSNGVFHIDSARAVTDAVAFEATGSIGVAADAYGEVDLTARSSSLTPLEEQLLGPPDPTEDETRLDGRLDANGTLRGSLSAFDLDAEARLERLVVSGNAAARTQARITGRALGTDHARLQTTLRADDVTLFGHHADSARIDIDVMGAHTAVHAQAESADEALRLAGGLGSAGDTLTVRIDSLVLGKGNAAWALRAPLLAERVRSAFDIQPFVLAAARGGAALTGGGRIAWGRNSIGEPVDFRVGLDNVPMHELLHLLRTEVGADGVISGNVLVQGTTDAPSIDVGVTLRQFAYNDATLDSVTGTLRYADQLLRTDLQAARDGSSALALNGTVPIDLRLVPVTERALEQPLQLRLTANEFPVAVALGVVDGFQEVEGRIDGRLEGAGTTRNPRLAGELHVANTAFTFVPLGVRYRDVNGTVAVVRDLILDVEATARAGDTRARTGPAVLRSQLGSAIVTGTVDFAQTTDPSFNLLLRADELLLTKRHDVELVATGDARLQGRYRRPEVSGDIRIESGALYLDELYRQYLVVGLDSPLLFEVVDTSLVSVRQVLPASENPFMRNVLVRDLHVTVGRDSWLRSRDLNVAVTGELDVDFDRQQEDIRLRGTLQAERGTYNLYYPPFTRRFTVREGTVDFPGTPGVDPNLAITAVYRAPRANDEPIDVLAQVTGTLQTPRVRLASDEQPPVSESDLASLLFFGVPTSGLNLGNTNLARASERSSVASFGLQALAPSVIGSLASGLQSIGQTYGLVDYVGLTATEGTVGTQQTGVFAGWLANTRIELGRYITPQLFVAYTQRLADPANSAGWRLEWEINPTISAELFLEDRFAREPDFGFTESAALRKVYGFFLFREWTY